VALSLAIDPIPALRSSDYPLDWLFAGVRGVPLAYRYLRWEHTSFTLISYKDFTFEETLEGAYAFLHIPVMTQAALPGSLGYATRLEIVEKAYQRFSALHKDIAVWRYEWRFYMLEKN
jgi:hypothetical protein